MANQRQRRARQIYRKAHPELFPKIEPTPPKDPSKKKKSKRNFKRKKAGSITVNSSAAFKKRILRKHPLRVPGMRPGESCYICKSQGHIAKYCPEKSEREKNKICLLCRRRGHSLKNCPDKNDDAIDKKFCYNCGEAGHALSACSHPLRDGGTKFATCFICNEQGHLSKNCTRNTHGIYPKGGCCNICRGVTHLAKDCPLKNNNDSSEAGKTYMNSKLESRGRVTKFVSGDDLDDDFMGDDKKMKPSEISVVSESKSSSVKSRKERSKVVNFMG